MSKKNSMETNGHPQDILLEPNSVESEVNVGEDLVDFITAIDKTFDHNIKICTEYLNLLEKWDEIEDKYEQDILVKYAKLKGTLWGEWYDFNIKKSLKKMKKKIGKKRKMKTLVGKKGVTGMRKERLG